MTSKATELRKGTVLIMDGELLIITDYNHATPGNLRAVIQIKTKNLMTGQVSQFRPAAGDSFETAYLDRKKSQYLYRESNGDYVFMDEATYEQFTLTQEMAAEKMAYIKENQTVEVTFHETTPIDVDLPPSVVLAVTESEAAVKGNSATGVKKEAVLETGLTVKVPMHIDVGELIKINTSTGEFLGRANQEG